MDAKYCPTCAGEGEIDIPDTWDVAPNGNDSDGPFVCEHAECPTCGGDGLRKAWHAPECVEMPSPRECSHCGDISPSDLPTCDDCCDRVCQRCAKSGRVAGVVTWCLCNDCDDPSENHLTWNAVS